MLGGLRELGYEDTKKLIKRTKHTTCHNEPIPPKFIGRDIDILAQTIKDIVNNSLGNSTSGWYLEMVFNSPITKENRSRQVIV